MALSVVFGLYPCGFERNTTFSPTQTFHTTIVAAQSQVTFSLRFYLETLTHFVNVSALAFTFCGPEHNTTFDTTAKLGDSWDTPSQWGDPFSI